MRYEILKKTLLYRLIAYAVTILINLGSPLGTVLSIIFATVSEVSSLIIYYIYEFYWRKYVDRRHLREGTSVLSITGDSKVRIAYEVIEDLGEGKLLIKVI